MKRVTRSICRLAGLMAIVGVSFSLGFAWKAEAETLSCKGESCNNLTPVEYGCDADAQVIGEVTQTITRWQDLWQPQEIIIQHVYSEHCRANWTKAYVPDGAFLYIQERDFVDGIQPTRGTLRANGSGYVWADSNMSAASAVNQACVSLPLLSNKNGYDLFDRYCTDFNK